MVVQRPKGYYIRGEIFFMNWAHMGIEKFVFLPRFKKSKLTLVTKCT
jgi:hypothetical protein